MEPATPPPRSPPPPVAVAPPPRGAPVVTLKRRLTFAAAHALSNPALPPAASAALYGRCASPHGHNYTLWVSVRAPLDPVSGMVCCAAALKATMSAAVADMDHADLGGIPALGGVSTVERVAVLLWERLAGAGGLGGVLAEVELAETENIRAVYRGEWHADAGGRAPEAPG